MNTWYGATATDRRQVHMDGQRLYWVHKWKKTPSRVHLRSENTPIYPERVVHENKWKKTASLHDIIQYNSIHLCATFLRFDEFQCWQCMKTNGRKHLLICTFERITRTYFQSYVWKHLHFVRNTIFLSGRWFYLQSLNLFDTSYLIFWRLQELITFTTFTCSIWQSYVVHA